MEMTDLIWQLMARSLAKEATAEEMLQLQALLRHHPTLHQQYDLLSRIWNDKQHQAPDEEEARSAIRKIISKAGDDTAIYYHDPFAVIEQARRASRRRVWIGVLLLVLGIGISTGILYNGKKASAVASGEGSADRETLVVKNGSRSRFVLSDGSTVWLNGGSSLQYLTDFTGPTREVRLEGEAYFDVVKKDGKPFIVHTGDVDIKVLGTSFNIKSYPEDATVEATLYHGAVQVTRPAVPGKAIRLRPNEKLIIKRMTGSRAEAASAGISPARNADNTYTLTYIDSTKKVNERFETAWLYSRLEFRGDSFEELARKLERWYNITIVFKDEKVKKLHFNGSFRQETVEQAFLALKEANSFTYQINNHEISVASSE